MKSYTAEYKKMYLTGIGWDGVSMSPSETLISYKTLQSVVIALCQMDGLGFADDGEELVIRAYNVKNKNILELKE